VSKKSLFYFPLYSLASGLIRVTSSSVRVVYNSVKTARVSIRVVKTIRGSRFVYKAARPKAVVLLALATLPYTLITLSNST
jgi:hypothetical protein